MYLHLLYVSIYLPTLPQELEGHFLKQSLTALNLVIKLIDWLPYQGWGAQSTLLFTHSWSDNNWIHTFLREMRIGASRIWTLFAMSIFYDGNEYTMKAFSVCMYVYIYIYIYIYINNERPLTFRYTSLENHFFNFQWHREKYSGIYLFFQNYCQDNTNECKTID